MAAILWGTWSLFLRPTGLSGIFTAPIVLAVIGVTAWPLVRLDPRSPRWDRQTVAILILYGAADALNAGTFFYSMQVTTVAVAVLTHCTAPLIIAGLAPRIDGVRVPGSVAAAGVALVGLALLLRPWEIEAGEAGASLWLGAGLGGLSAIGYATAVFSAKALSARIGVGRATSYHALVGATFFVPLAIAFPETVEASDVAWLVVGALACGTLATWLFLDGLARIGSARAAVLTFLEPAVAVLVGWLYWGESLGALSAVGGALVLGAAGYVARAKPVARA
ncbi:MAG: DMT family transporter [Sandaracinaceae bacterium]|nr:DMT family transporter [Sandaracinaceae bacterium]